MNYAVFFIVVSVVFTAISAELGVFFGNGLYSRTEYGALISILSCSYSLRLLETHANDETCWGGFWIRIM